jgi:excisionase family DNA binding protein
MSEAMQPYLTTEEVATRLKVHPNTIFRYISEGKLRATKIGKSYRIAEVDLERLLGAEDRSGKARVVVIASQKGGVGKTAAAVSLAAALGSTLGKRVLLVDLDPQAGCALCIGRDTSDLNQTIHTVLTQPQTSLRSIVAKTDFGFDLAPSNIDLAAAELSLKEVMAREYVLARKIAPILKDYDLVIIDTPPTLGMLTLNALTAADYVIIPVAMQYMALRGLDTLLATIEQVRGTLNHTIQLLGILANIYDARTLHSKEIYDVTVHLGQGCYAARASPAVATGGAVGSNEGATTPSTAAWVASVR